MAFKYFLQIVVALGLPAIVVAQQIVVIDKPSANGWLVSYNIASDKDSGTGGWQATAQCKTIATAKKEAARLQAMPKGQWTSPVKIYIVGANAKDSQPDSNSVPQSPTLVQRVLQTAQNVQDEKEKVDLGFWVVKLLNDPEVAMQEKGVEEGKKYGPGSILKEYSESIANAFQHASDLKNGLINMDKELMDKSFKSVNDAIEKYNANVDTGTKLFGKNNPLTKMNPVNLESVQSVEEWKSSLKKQFVLEDEKARLDSAKVRLDKERAEIVAEWNMLTPNETTPDSADPRVIQIRERMKAYQANKQKYQRILSDYTHQVTTLKETLARFQTSPKNHEGFVGVWATASDSFILRIENGGKLYVTNTSSAGSLSAGRWNEAKSSLRGRTDSVYAGEEQWTTTYGIIYDLEEGKVIGGKLHVKMMTNYLSENGIENPFGRHWNDMEFSRVPSNYRHMKSWFLLKHK